MQTRYFSLGLGIVYVLVGIVGFIPAFYTSPPASAPHLQVTASYGYLFGIFPINALHNVVHIVVGLAGIIAWSRLILAEVYCRTLFIVFGLLTVLGFIPQADTIFGYVPLFGNDTWLHTATALSSAFFGWVPTAQNVPAEPVASHSH